MARQILAGHFAFIPFRFYNGDMVGLTALHFDHLRTQTFTNVVLHRGSSPVTICVNWSEKEHRSTADILNGTIDVFSGHKSHRKLISSMKVDSLSSQPFPQVLFDRESGEAFITLWAAIDDHGGTRVYRFEKERPTYLRNSELYQASPGAIRERSNGELVRFVPLEGHHPTPPVSRTMKFDLKKHDFVAGKWVEESFDTPNHRVLSLTSNGHRYRVELRHRNFRLGNRKLTSSKSGFILCDGLVTHGSDLMPTEKMTQKQKAGIFMTELTTFKVWIDDKPVTIPSRLWKTCFDVHLAPKYLKLRSIKTGVQVKASASDGGGGYIVTWTIRTDGSCRRNVVSED